MAGPTPDSATPPPMTPPGAGPGSATPPDPSKGMPTPVGGGKPPAPMGMPGAPAGPKPPEPESPEKKLNKESLEKLLENIDKALNKGLKDEEDIINYLLNDDWSEDRLDSLARVLKKNLPDFLIEMVDLVKDKGLERANDILDEKISDAETKEEEIKKKILEKKNKQMEEESTGQPPVGGIPIPPKMSNQSDVYLYSNKLKRGGKMSKKLVFKDGALVEEPVTASAIINNLSFSIRKAKSFIKDLDDLKLKYAGVEALRKQALDELIGDPAAPDMPAPDAMESPELDSLDKDKDSLIDELADKVEDIQGLVDELKGGAEDVPKDITEDMAEDSDTVDKMEDKKLEAKELVTKLRKVAKETEVFIKQAKDEDSFPFNLKKKDKKDDKKDDEKDEKKDKKDEKKDKKDEKMSKEELIGKVKERLAELREKESNLYRFKEQIKPIPPVDNINAETAKKQYGATLDKKNYEKDKDTETINPKNIADKTLNVRKETGTKGKEKVSIEVAEKLRKHSMQDVASKAKLSVELAAQQQFKGLIDDPLKEAFFINMREAGISEEVASAIIHNAYVDGYEKSQKTILKEAFETFMNKGIEDFVEVSKFVKAYKVENIGSVKIAQEEVEEDLREKKASTLPLRASQVGDNSRESYKKYWSSVEKERRGY